MTAAGAAPRELVVLSGKGGTGKTSLAASFAALGRPCVVADCDVDAADLHLVLGPRVLEWHEFRSGEEAVVRQGDCTGCGDCLARCRFDAISESGRGAVPGSVRVDPLACEGCGVCARFCPAGAIGMRERVCGAWMVSDTRHGPLVHARLAIGSGNSGKLVSTVRDEARRRARASGARLVIVDGPPGIACPAIAAVTGATRVLAVTEPSVSGEHDLERLLALAGHFALPVSVCVNRWDVSQAMTERIERRALRRGAHLAGRVRHDPAVSRAQIAGRAVVEIPSAAADDVRAVWEGLVTALEAPDGRARGGREDERCPVVGGFA